MFFENIVLFKDHKYTVGLNKTHLIHKQEGCRSLFSPVRNYWHLQFDIQERNPSEGFMYSLKQPLTFTVREN